MRDNGALLRVTGEYYEGYMIKEYFLLDPNASVKFRVTYSWYDQNKNKTMDANDRYVLNGREATQEEYDQAEEQYGQTGVGSIHWYYLARQNLA